MKEKFQFISKDKTLIKGIEWPVASQEVRKVVYISHGMAEHIERYDHFAKYMNFNGFAVMGHDHRGHGQSSESIDHLGVFSKGDWDLMREDLHQGICLAKERYPEAEVILFGHSMGSFLARDYLLSYQDIERVIICGTGFLGKGALSSGYLLAGLVCKFKDESAPSRFLDKMSFGLYNRKIMGPMTAFDWLSTDSDQVAKYINDPYCGNVHSARFFKEFTGALKRILYQSRDIDIDPKLKMLIVSGAEDPVGNYSKGVKKTYKYYDQVLDSVEMILYAKGRHEILNEKDNEKVYDDILNWIIK